MRDVLDSRDRWPSPHQCQAVPAPASFEAKYEAGMFGFSKKTVGTLKFDDANSRIVFYGEDKKEMFGVPYDALRLGV